MVPRSVFKRRDAFSINLSEGVAQDLPANCSSSLGGGHLLAGTALPPSRHWGCEGHAMPRLGCVRGSASFHQCECCSDGVFKQIPCFWGNFQFIGDVMGWKSHFWKWEGTEFQRPWQSALMCPLPVCPLILPLVKLNGDRDQPNHLGIFFKWFSKTGACNKEVF